MTGLFIEPKQQYPQPNQSLLQDLFILDFKGLSAYQDFKKYFFQWLVSLFIYAEICLNIIVIQEENHLLWAYIDQSEQIMQISTTNKEFMQLINHPLFQDAACVPKDLKYVLLYCETNQKYQHKMKILLPYHKKDTTFAELEEKLAIYGYSHNGSKFKIIIPNGTGFAIHKQGQVKQTIQSFKKKFGKKEERIETFTICPEVVGIEDLSSRPIINRDKSQICLIVHAKQLEVISLQMKWPLTTDLLTAVMDKLKAFYNVDLNPEDLNLSILQIEIKLQNEAFSLLYKKSPITDQQQLLKTIFFSSKLIFVQIDIINSKFLAAQLHNPAKKALEIVSYHNQQIKKKKVHAQIQRFLILQSEKPLGIRIHYNEVKSFKIKYLLAILKVQDWDRKGLMVLGKIYKPDELISSFQKVFKIGTDCNFVHAKITSQKELFYSCIENGNDAFKPDQVKQLLDINPNKNVYCPCLSAYMNQALFPNDHNEKQQLITQIIQDYIYKYFIEIPIYEQTPWERYIKSMLLELASFETYRGWAFRVVDYRYDRPIYHKIQFTNFLVASKREDKTAFKLKVYPEQPKTLFKIKSVSGILIDQISSFHMNQVIFRPYTSFQIIRKIEKENIIEYELEEVKPIETITRCTLLVWVDDKKDEGLNIFYALKKANIHYPIYLFQVASNAELIGQFEKHQKLFNDINAKKIVISNMKRMQQGIIDQKAGVQTYRIAQKRFKTNMEFIFYIGYIKGTCDKLEENKISPDTCTILNDGNLLLKKLVDLANPKKNASQDHASIIQEEKEEEGNPQWSGVFSTLKSVKSQGHK